MRGSSREAGMLRLTGFGLLRRGAARYLLAAVLVMEPVVIALIFARERASRRADQEKLAASLNPDNLWSENVAKAISRPRIVGVQEAKLRPDEVVVGIEVGGKARAYRIA